MYIAQPLERRACRTLQDEKYEYAEDIPSYVLALIPQKHRKHISAALYEIINGELGEVWLTENSRPYDLSAEYHTPAYWVLDSHCHICRATKHHKRYCPYHAISK